MSRIAKRVSIAAQPAQSMVCRSIARRMQTVLTLVCGVMIGVVLKSQIALDGHRVRLRQQELRMHPNLMGRREGMPWEGVGVAGSWEGNTSTQLPYWFEIEGKVPPLIHQIWDDDTVENTCQISAQSWEWFCSVYGCKHHLWRRKDLESFTPFINRQYYLDIQSPQMRADLARLEILNKHGGLYLDCDMIWGGRSRASDSFVKKMMHSEFTLAASNDIKNATGRDKTLDLAVVFFTNRVMGSPPRSPIVGRAIELAQDRLDEHSQKMQAATKAAMGKGFKLAGVTKPKLRAFHMTGPHVLNLALQEVGTSIPVDVIPTKWVYPEVMTDAENIVMFGHSKDRALHAGTVGRPAVNAAKPWLMQRSLPNFFTVAQDEDSQYSPTDYLVQPGNPANPTGAVAVFLHHNKAGGTGVKVALQQMYNSTPGLTHVDVFSKSACAYSTAAIWRSKMRTNSTEKFCNNKLWSERKLPGCGRCRAPGVEHLYADLAKIAAKETPTSTSIPTTTATSDMNNATNAAGETQDVAPNGWVGKKGTVKCADFKRQGKCKIPILRGKCCKTCGEVSCPSAVAEGPNVMEEVAPGGAIGAVAQRKCGILKSQGMCTDPRIRGFCCVTCGSTACSVPHVIVGDYAMGLCNVLPASRPCAYYTMLRDPRKRMASSYLHCKYEPDDQLCMSHVLQARDATFAEWVVHQGNYLFRQLTFDLSRALSVEEQYEMYMQHAKHKLQVAKMGVDGAWAPETRALSQEDVDDDLIEEMLQFKPNLMWLLEQTRGFTITEHDAKAMVDLLEYRFAVLGLVEHFDESLEMYEAVFGLPFPDAMLHKSQAQADHQMHRHSGEDMDRRKQVQEELLAQFTTNPELDQLISIDLDLYDRATELFERQRGVMNQMRLQAIGDQDLDSVDAATDDNEKKPSWLSRIGSFLTNAKPTSSLASTTDVLEEMQPLEEGSNDTQKDMDTPVDATPEPAAQPAAGSVADPTAIPVLHGIKPEGLPAVANIEPYAAQDVWKQTKVKAPSSNIRMGMADRGQKATENSEPTAMGMAMGTPDVADMEVPEPAMGMAMGKRKKADIVVAQATAMGMAMGQRGETDTAIVERTPATDSVPIDPSQMTEEDLAAAAEAQSLGTKRRLLLE